jgi:hypothetical protein
MTKQAIFLACHDQSGDVLRALSACTPVLRNLFQTTCLSLTPPTLEAQPELCAVFREDDYFRIYIPRHIPIGNQTVGEQFRSFYTWSLKHVHPESLVHLAFPDRVAFALLSDYTLDFANSIKNLEADDTPMIYHRSETAWQTHPANYRALEGMVTQAGEMLLGKTLDFAWAHIAVRAGRLSKALQQTRQMDWSFVAELVLCLEPGVKTRDVDWLAWEDPFILGLEAENLRRERESDADETRFRMSYVASMLQLLSRDGTAPGRD